LASDRFEAIVADFGFLDDWEDRYRYLIELGRAMPGLADNERSPEFKVDGCASQVWIVPEPEGNRFSFRGDSDALIVRGLMAVLHALYDGLSPADVLAIDAGAAFGRLGLEQHLSSQRSNGLRAMVVRIRTIAAAGAAGQDRK
jgi:cysteine desulfuration protein SufE